MTPIEIARDYLDSWSTHDLTRIMAHIAPHCVFVNGTINTTTGAEPLRALFAQYLAGYQAFKFETLHLALAADGITVLNERLDYLYKDGVRIDIPCAGAIMVEHGQITAIRDYFDLQSVIAQRPNPAD